METIEVNLETMEIIQARGYDNEPSSYNKDILKIVKRKLPEIKKLHRQQLNQSA